MRQNQHGKCGVGISEPKIQLALSVPNLYGDLRCHTEKQIKKYKQVHIWKGNEILAANLF